jgi:benzoyl-CoA 2,3-dioxygenase component B
MLTEEAFHMFVGTGGITRVVKRTLEVMKALGSEDPAAVRNAGAIDLSTLQRYINFWFSSSIDLFGAEISSNAASYFASSLKGRPDEARFADHLASDQSLRIEVPDGEGGVAAEEVPMRSAMNEVTRAAYVRDCDVGVQRWNRLVAEAGCDFRFRLPSTRA